MNDFWERSIQYVRNGKCYIVYEGITYIADEYGIYPIVTNDNRCNYSRGFIWLEHDLTKPEKFNLN